MTDPIPYKAEGQWGIRKDAEADQALQSVRDWRAAAIAAGWAHEPTYPTCEGEDRAMRLRGPGGWVALTLARDDRDKGRKAKADIKLWGPDGLAVRVPPLFDMAALEAGQLRCSRCKAEGVPTERVGFAGRVCGSCIEAARREIETPGWNS